MFVQSYMTGQNKHMESFAQVSSIHQWANSRHWINQSERALYDGYVINQNVKQEAGLAWLPVSENACLISYLHPVIL